MWNQSIVAISPYSFSILFYQGHRGAVAHSLIVNVTVVIRFPLEGMHYFHFYRLPIILPFFQFHL